MLTQVKQKPTFIALSLLSIGSLIGSFGYPLQKLELYRQVEMGSFNTPITKTYLLTENLLNYPYGFQKDRAKLFAQIHVDYKLQKILLLCTAIGTSVGALLIGKELVPLTEYEEEIARIRNEAKKELTLKGIKQKYALASKSQQLLFLDDMKVLMAEFGSSEQETLEADELNALYDQVESNALPKDEPTVELPSSEETFRKTFPESLDPTAWKSITKALSEGLNKAEICRDVLQCPDEVGNAYIASLSRRYL